MSADLPILTPKTLPPPCTIFVFNCQYEEYSDTEGGHTWQRTITLTNIKLLPHHKEWDPIKDLANALAEILTSGAPVSWDFEIIPGSESPPADLTEEIRRLKRRVSRLEEAVIHP